jgi:hypothetical protein
MRKLNTLLGLFLVWVGDKVATFGYRVFKRSATTEEYVTFVNHALRPLGVKVETAEVTAPQTKTNMDVLNSYLEKHSREVGGGYDN